MKLTNNYDYGFMGARVKQARNLKHYTQTKLAEMINMSSKNLSELERGFAGISIPTLIALCENLDISADYILFGENSGHQPDVISCLVSELSEKNRLQAEKLIEVFVEACKD